MFWSLSGLEENNNREWFHAQKERYQEARCAFEELLAGLMRELRANGEAIPLFEPKELTFKLMRDTRFSHDKSPYTPCFRAHISKEGKLPVPVGYYLYLRPGNRSFLGGGLFADMFKDATRLVRDYIAAHGEEWEKLLSEPSFQKTFTVSGSALKNVPRGYDAAHPQAEYLKNKSWYLEYPVSDEELLAEDFPARAVAIFLRMRPFNAFLNEALKDFSMPKR